jgi:hypothetical protein
MYVKIGDYTHPVNEVNLRRMEIKHRYSPRNKRLTKIITLYLEGELLASTQSGITTAIGELLDAYRDDYNEIRLYQDDDTPTYHGIDNLDSISGVKILGRNWPKGDAAEYASKRTFSITAYSEYADAESQLVYWQETVRQIGSGGPRREVRDFYTGPREAITQLRTAVRVIQSGRAIGFTAYVTPPGPIYPAAVDHESMMQEFGSGQQQGLMACFYPSRWAYVHTLTNLSSGLIAPQTR